MPSHRIVLGNSVANVALPMNLIGVTFMAFTNCVFGCFTNYVIGSTLRYAANWSICQYSSNRLKLCCLVRNQNSYQARVQRVLIKLVTTWIRLWAASYLCTVWCWWCRASRRTIEQKTSFEQDCCFIAIVSEFLSYTFSQVSTGIYLCNMYCRQSVVLSNIFSTSTEIITYNMFIY